jgi:hypothetical protein
MEGNHERAEIYFLGLALDGSIGDDEPVRAGVRALLQLSHHAQQPGRLQQRRSRCLNRAP